MISTILWIVSFFSLWLIIVWLQVLYLAEPEKNKNKNLPNITIAVPAYNEEKTIEKTITSIVKADYPKEKVEIIVVNDGSKDNTSRITKSLIKKFKESNIILIDKKNGGKSSALNKALKIAKGDIFGVVDADSRIKPDCIKLLVPHLDEEGTGAVISRMKADSPKSILERIQRFEYIMSNMIRKLMASIGTLYMTPGVLSIYKTNLLRELGGFDENNITEDLEIAMRLKYNNYKVKMEQESIIYTAVPQTIKALWKQRIRWARGYIQNHWKYKSMFFSKKHSTFGMFQMPVNILVVSLLIINISIIGYAFLKDSLEFMIRSITIEGYFLNNFIDWPSIKEIMLSQNLRVVFPITILTLLGFYLIFLTHKIFKEKIARNIIPIAAYFLFLPYFMTLNWISSFTQEMMKTKRKW